MRFFISLEMTSAAKDYLNRIIRNLKDILGPANYTFRDNLHLTLAFSKDASKEEVDTLYKILKEEFTLAKRIMENTHNVDCFDKGEKQLFFLKLRDSSGEISALANRVRRAMDSTKIDYDKKPFMPHITLARNVSIDLASQTAKSLKFDDFTFVFTKIFFYKSERIDNRMKYTPLYKIELVN